MLAKRIIPCLDLKDGRIVKGTNFVGLRDVGDPLELAVIYNRSGADELIFLDIAASYEERGTLLDNVSRIAEELSIPFTVGGGVESPLDVEALLKAGADKVSISSAAVKDPTLISRVAKEFGSECIIVAIDAKWVSDKKCWEVVIHGGRHHTGLDVLDWVKQIEELGAGEILLTSMDADGTKNGYDNRLTASVASSVQIPVIASGGAGKLEHFRDVLTIGQANAALAASLFHFNELSVEEVKAYLELHNIPVRGRK